MKGTMVKCLQCNTVSVYMTAHNGTDRCPICKGYAIPHGECNIVEEDILRTSFYGPDGLIETICTSVDFLHMSNKDDSVYKLAEIVGK